MSPSYFRLPSEVANKTLSGEAELGMGFQFASLTPAQRAGPAKFNHRQNDVDFLILNGTIALNREAYFAIRQRDHEAIDVLASLVESDYQNIRTIEEFETEVGSLYLQQDIGRYEEFTGESIRYDEDVRRSEQPLHGSPPFRAYSRAGDGFFRFSAFRNDFRVGADGSLSAGTYATSSSDRTAVPNALAAVGRYALANPVAPVHVFEIMPPPGSPLLFGTVAPKHGQAGGGAEVEFQTALPPGSVVYRGTTSVW